MKPFDSTWLDCRMEGLAAGLGVRGWCLFPEQHLITSSLYGLMSFITLLMRHIVMKSSWLWFLLLLLPSFHPSIPQETRHCQGGMPGWMQWMQWMQWSLQAAAQLTDSLLLCLSGFLLRSNLTQVTWCCSATSTPGFTEQNLQWRPGDPSVAAPSSSLCSNTLRKMS